MLRALTAVASAVLMFVGAGTRPAASSGIVSLQQERSAYFAIGHVWTPGKFPLTDGMTVAEALAQAGGVTERGAQSEVKILRVVDGERVTLDATLQDLVTHNDTVYVPRASAAVLQDTQASPVFYIAGHVRSPGKYPLSDGMTVLEAIAVAGGVTDRGMTRRIKIRRMVDGELVDVTVTLNDLVQDKDTLTIPQRLI